MAYTKLWQKILTSSIWNEDLVTKVVWITMLALKDEKHMVLGSVGGIAHQARVTPSQCREALEKLTSPDPDDSSKIADGRRLIPVDGGWFVVNGELYRNSQDPDERRATQAAYMRDYRARKKNVTNVITGNNGSSQVSEVSECNESGPSEQIITEQIITEDTASELASGSSSDSSSKNRNETEPSVELFTADTNQGQTVPVPVTVPVEPPKVKRAKNPSSPASEVAIPPELDTPEFRTSWDEWLQYRREKKLPKLTPMSLRKQFEELASWGVDRAIAAINHSIRNTWTGIFEPSQPKPSRPKPNDISSITGRPFPKDNTEKSW